MKKIIKNKKIGKTLLSVMCTGALIVGFSAIPANVQNVNAQTSITQVGSVALQQSLKVLNAKMLNQTVDSSVQVSTWADLVTAVAEAQDGAIINITTNLEVTSSITISGKSITINGGNFTLDNSTWLKNVFTVNADATLNLNNVVIDGGAETWEVDYDNINIPSNKNYAYIYLKNYESEGKQTASAIVSNGALNVSYLTVQNIYSQVRGAAINIQKGSAILDYCTFTRNAGNPGGAVNIGAALDKSSADVAYAVSSALVTNCNFSNNYSKGRGGAINAYGVENLIVKNSNFISNTAGEAGNGGAIMFDRVSGSTAGNWSAAEDYNLSYPQMEVDNCIFEGNYCGNDGSAIENEDAESVIKNCTFKNNVGAHKNGGSVGTASYQIGRKEWGNHILTDCTFEGNEGSVSGIGDHAGVTILDISNTTFKGNSGSSSVLLYSSKTTIENVSFENENVLTTVIDARSAEAEGSGMYTEEIPGPSLTFKNSSITGTVGGEDILVRSYSYATDRIPYQVNFEGETEADVSIWGDNYVTVSGEHSGNLELDATAPETNLTVEDTATVDGEIKKVNTFKVVFKYTNTQSQEKTLFLDLDKDIVYTPAKISQYLDAEDAGNMLYWYTDKAYLAAWDGVPAGGLTVYGQYEAHTHNYNTFLVEGSIIYEACQCGDTQKQLGMSVGENLVYNGTVQGVNITNTLGIAETDYTITYYKKGANDEWYDLNATPVNAGEYKAVLTWSTYTVDLVYTINKATYDLSNIKFEDATAYYNKKDHSILISGTLPDGVTVTYENNSNREVGEYTVIAHFTVTNPNYNQIEDMTATLTIKKFSPVMSAVWGAGVTLVSSILVVVLSLLKIKPKKDEK